VACLKLIKSLQDKGLRPSKVVGLGKSQLEMLVPDAGTFKSEDAAEIFHKIHPPLKSGRYDDVRNIISIQLQRYGVQKFITNVISDLNVLIGDAWLNGDLEIYQEHIYAEIVIDLLRSSMAMMPHPKEQPIILLTTPPGEPHEIGLRMAQAIFTLNGASTIALGVQTPIDDIVQAAADVCANIVALSFSVACAKRNTVNFLRELRCALPDRVALWAGGEGIAALDAPLQGIHLIANFDQAIDLLKAYSFK
jgi:methanogenic corrinoid protein MtbC1